MDKNNLELEILKLKSTVDAQSETIREMYKLLGLHKALLKLIIDKNGGLDFLK